MEITEIGSIYDFMYKSCQLKLFSSATEVEKLNQVQDLNCRIFSLRATQLFQNHYKPTYVLTSTKKIRTFFENSHFLKVFWIKITFQVLTLLTSNKKHLFHQPFLHINQ